VVANAKIVDKGEMPDSEEWTFGAHGIEIWIQQRAGGIEFAVFEIESGRFLSDYFVTFPAEEGG
jgi:hypothetical protein